MIRGSTLARRLWPLKCIIVTSLWRRKYLKDKLMSITTATWSKKEEKDYYQDPNINNMISKQHQVLYRKSAENSFHQPKDFRFSPDSGVKYTKEKKKIFVVLCCCYSANLWWSAKTDIKYGVGAGKYWDIKLPFLHLLLLFYLPVCVLSSI